MSSWWVINKYENVYRIVTACSAADAVAKAVRIHGDDKTFLPLQESHGESYLIVIQIVGDERQFEVRPTTTWTVKQ
jgi:hypothetical protein